MIWCFLKISKNSIDEENNPNLHAELQNSKLINSNIRKKLLSEKQILKNN